METPQIRPGAVKSPESKLRVVAFFHNAAEGNLAIQLLTAIGIPNDRLGVTPPDQIEGGQGMILSIGCPDEKMLAKTEDLCRKPGCPPPSAAGVTGRGPSSLEVGRGDQPMRLQVGRELLHPAPADLACAIGRSGASASFLVLPRSGLPIRPTSPSFAREVPSVRSGPPVLAFNGKDLTGFYTYLHDHKYDDPDHVFTVRDGLLVISGQEFGGLTTREEFGDYHLITEWKWGGKTWPPRVDKVLATRASCSTASAPTAPRAGTGWNRRSARSSRGAAATSSWSAARPSRA